MKINKKQLQSIILEEFTKELKEKNLTTEGWMDSIKSMLGFGEKEPEKGKSLEELMQDVIDAAQPLEPLGGRNAPESGAMAMGGRAGFDAITKATGRGAFSGRGHDVVQEIDTKISELAGMVAGIDAIHSAIHDTVLEATGDRAAANRAYQEAMPHSKLRDEYFFIKLSLKTYELAYRHRIVVPYLYKHSPEGIKAAAAARKKAKRDFEINSAWNANQAAGRVLRLGMAARGQRFEGRMKITEKNIIAMIQEEITAHIGEDDA